MIQIKDVTKLYPAKAAVAPTSGKNGETRGTRGKENGAIHALDHISLHVAQGEWLSIMGPSGSGKSTLVNLIGCLDRPTSGQIWLDGQNVAGISANELNRVRAEKIVFIFQQFHLIPCSVSECFSMASEAFNLAEQFQTLVFVMSDLDLGMNNWMSDPFEYPAIPIQRGKVLHKADLDKLGGFARYKDLDGDGVGYRTLPGTDHPAAAYFTRGSGHNDKSSYSERPDDYENNMERLNRKFETARSFVPRPEIFRGTNAKIGIIAYGTSHWGIIESRDQLKNEYAIETDYLRLRAYPFTREVHEFIEQHDRIYVVEQNRDAQMLSLLKLDLKPELTTRLRSIAHLDGLPLDARSVTDELSTMEGK